MGTEPAGMRDRRWLREPPASPADYALRERDSAERLRGSFQSGSEWVSTSIYDWECVVVFLVGVRMVASRAPSRPCVSCGWLRAFD